jgi:hypothetical protein
MSEIIQPPEDFSLTDSERNSQVWKKLKRYLEEANESDRKKNDSMSLGNKQTRNLRAMIAARKSLLQLDR